MFITENVLKCTAHCVLNKDVMKTLLISTLVAFTALFGPLSFAQDFKHFKLKGALKDVSQPQSGVRSMKSSMAKKQGQKVINRIIAEKILDMDLSSKSIIEDEVAPLLQKIMDLVGTSYNQIGDNQTQPLLLSHDIGGGVLNFSGFSWQKPISTVGLWANREIAPDLFSDRWIVHDTLLVRIAAQTLLSTLADEELIDIDAETLGAFAGISFQRTYHYYHFADSWSDGLTADYSKLFLSFAKFTVSNALNMAPYELMKKEDQFAFNAGGFVNSPPAYGFSLRGGVLVNVAFENELTIQSLGEADQRREDEFLRLSVDKKWDVSAGAHLSLQLDFFNLLKLTILSYDLEYTYGKSNKLHLSFFNSDRKTIDGSEPHKKEFKKLVTGREDKVEHWRDHIVQQDERMTQNLNSKYSALLLGKIRKKETEQVKVVKDGIEKTFFKHYSQSIKYIQNIFSKIFNIVIVKIFKFDTAVKNFAESNKTLAVEYEHTEGIGKTKVDSERKFSVTLSQEYSAGKTHRWVDKLFKKEAIKHIKNWSSIESNIVDLVNNETLRGPLSFESKIEVETAGLMHLNELGEQKVFEILVDLCRTKRKSKWLNANRRKKMLKRLQVGASACVKKLGNRYLKYIAEYQQFGYNDITKFRKFVGQFFSKSKNLAPIKRLFGQENIFIYGQLNAKTKDGLPFSTHFKSGLFRGLGVIDNFMRSGATTVPVKLLQ